MNQYFRFDEVLIDGKSYPVVVLTDADPPDRTDHWEPHGQSDNPEIADIFLELRDPEGWWKATVRDSGCVHLHRYHNVPCTVRDDEEHPQLIDYLHICDVDDLIERLTELKELAQSKFGKDWG